jgi:hypothetical protein
MLRHRPCTQPAAFVHTLHVVMCAETHLNDASGSKLPLDNAPQLSAEQVQALEQHAEAVSGGREQKPSCGTLIPQWPRVDGITVNTAAPCRGSGERLAETCWLFALIRLDASGNVLTP